MRIGWYLHHHGSGHLHRFLAVHAELGAVTAFSSLPRPDLIAHERWVQLPLDVGEMESVAQTAGGTLHWAPRGHPGLRERMGRISAWIAAERPDAFIVDVSVEVALLVRLHGVPVIWIVQRGRRDDLPHTLAYRACDAVVAPWTQALTESSGDVPAQTRPVGDVPAETRPVGDVPAETRFIGALSRFDGRTPRPAPDGRSVLVLLGRGGHEVTAADIHAAAQATPEWEWHVAGLPRAGSARVRFHDRTADVWELLAAADVVVASAGTNVIAEVAAARRPLIVLPQRRPFGEQDANAAALVAAGLADSHERWPSAAAWPGVLQAAAGRDPSRWALLHDGAAAGRLAAAVREVVCGSA